MAPPPRSRKCFLGSGSVTGGAVDVMKCFDQVQRVLVYDLVTTYGLDPEVVKAYSAMPDNRAVHNCICDSRVVGHKHTCGIPQGCVGVRCVSRQ